MPRFLVDLYPCKRCGKKIPVRSQQEAEQANCERCLEYERLGWQANYRAETAAKHVAAGGLEDLLQAAEAFASAAHVAIKASRLSPKRAEAMKWAGAAEDWGRRAFKAMSSLRSPLIQFARHERFVRAVDGGASGVPTEPPEIRAPLRLVAPDQPLPASERSALDLAAERWAAIRQSLGFRREVHVPSHWPKERVQMDRWIFLFAPSSRRRRPWDVWLREWMHLVNLTQHRVAPAHATGAEARAWAVAFAAEVGFQPLELTSPGKVVVLQHVLLAKAGDRLPR